MANPNHTRRACLTNIRSALKMQSETDGSILSDPLLKDDTVSLPRMGRPEYRLAIMDEDQFLSQSYVSSEGEVKLNVIIEWSVAMPKSLDVNDRRFDEIERGTAEIAQALLADLSLGGACEILEFTGLRSQDFDFGQIGQQSTHYISLSCLLDAVSLLS